MKNLYIIGAGGYLSEVLWIVEQMNEATPMWRDIIIIEDYLHHLVGTESRGYPIVGNLDHLIAVQEDVDVAIVINNVSVRKRLIERLMAEKKNVHFPNLVDPTSIIDTKTIRMGMGNIVGAFVVLSTNLDIGNFNIINSYSGIGHDTRIGDYNTFNPRVAVSGNVTLGDCNSFGLNASILEKKSMGSNNEVWLHSCVTKSVKDNLKLFGVPAKKIDL